MKETRTPIGIVDGLFVVMVFCGLAVSHGNPVWLACWLLWAIWRGL